MPPDARWLIGWRTGPGTGVRTAKAGGSGQEEEMAAGRARRPGGAWAWP
ncbi:hypothetical protein HMPREF9946_04284 [Acetobacteraceae bacterium AT-5844]|nr:hypothetical protein HMPREF9946_04284 [Acetobacteraceae bacterium AT-5844]